MLDLIKLKEQLESYPPGPWREDVKALAEEVQWLREAIHDHRKQAKKVYKEAQAWWDEYLWAVLDA